MDLAQHSAVYYPTRRLDVRRDLEQQPRVTDMESMMLRRKTELRHHWSCIPYITLQAFKSKELYYFQYAERCLPHNIEQTSVCMNSESLKFVLLFQFYVYNTKKMNVAGLSIFPRAFHFFYLLLFCLQMLNISHLVYFMVAFCHLL